MFSCWTGEYTDSPEFEEKLKKYDFDNKMSYKYSQEITYIPYYNNGAFLSGELTDVVKFKVYNGNSVEHQGTINVYYLTENRCTDYIDRETYAFELVGCDSLYLQGTTSDDLWLKLKE